MNLHGISVESNYISLGSRLGYAEIVLFASRMGNPSMRKSVLNETIAT
jgi:hypothetical protein